MWGGCSNIFKCTPADCILHIPYMALAKALRCLGCIGSLPERWWCPHRPCASLGQEGQRQLGLVQLVQIFCLLLKISVEGNTPEFTVFLEALLRRSITCLSKVKFVPCSPLCSSGLFRRAWWWFPKA